MVAPSHPVCPGLPAQRSGFAASPELASQRAGLRDAVGAGIWRTDPEPEELYIGAVRCLRFAGHGEPRATLLHFHGGALRIGCPEQVGPFAAAVAAQCDVDVVCPAYRLAPEYPFPAAIVDAWAVFSALRLQEGRIVAISGDSAGGAIAASLTALAVSYGAVPAALMLLSPWLDLTVTHESYTANAATDPWFSQAAAQAAAALYLQGAAPDHPCASPLHGRLLGFPPTFINVGSREVLAGDAIGMAQRVRNAGVTIELDLVEEMEHVAVTRDPTLSANARVMGRLTNFLRPLVG